MRILKYALVGLTAIAIVAGLILLSRPTQAQSNTESAKLAKFVALMQYFRTQPTPSDVHADRLGTFVFLDGALTDIYIDGFIAPFTGEKAEEVRQRLQSVSVEDGYTAAMVESYRLASSPVLLDILHDLLARYYVDLFTTADLSGAPGFLGKSEIQSLAGGFVSSDYALPAPSTTQTPGSMSQPSLTLKYDPAGPDRDCSDFATWREAQAFYLATENDSHGLDPDGDDVACADLPGAPETIAPTPTFPNTLTGGTHRVGVDMEPGLYRGVIPTTESYSSCSWERWRLNGALKYRVERDIHLADGYQFYVRALDSDYELVSTCSLTRVTDFTRPPEAELPDTIEPGMYLVGVEVKPGLYNGVVPTEGHTSCSWSRLSDFTGSYGETIDSDIYFNDGFNFSLAISSNDYGFETSCQLTRVQ